jgi:hypothetical protein
LIHAIQSGHFWQNSDLRSVLVNQLNCCEVRNVCDDDDDDDDKFWGTNDLWNSKAAFLRNAEPTL